MVNYFLKNKMTLQEIQKIIGVKEDGIMGPKTQAAIKAYQTAHGLIPDGIIGPKTIAVMQGSSNTSSNTPINKFEENYSVAGDTQTSTYNFQENAKNEEIFKKTVTGSLGIAGTSGIMNPNFISTLLSDSSIVAYYTHALTYGNYTIGDMLNDAKRRELISQGNTKLEDLKIIDPEVIREQYTQTAEGQQATTDTAKNIPTFDFQGLLNPEILKYAANNIPESLFAEAVPGTDPNSAEFKKAVEDVKATYFDLANAALSATTEQQKAVADENLKQFTKQLNERYGITLSDNADKAWGQIEDLGNTMNTRGLLGGGIANEAIDETLQTTRNNDQRQRLAKLTEKEQQELNTLLSSGNPNEIAAKIAQLDAEDAKNGVNPNDYRSKMFKVPSDIVAKYSLQSLRTQYPNKTEKEIKAIHDTIMDENGNYRSGIYKTYYKGIADQEIADTINANARVTLSNQNKDLQRANNTLGDVTGTDPLNPIIKTDSVPTGTGLKEAGKAAEGISASINEYNSNTGAKLQQGEKYTNSSGQVITQGTPYVAPTPVVTPTQPVNTVNQTQNVNTNTIAPYKIAYGDTLSKIAAKNKTTVAALAKLNNISDPNKIQAGQTIKFS